jgi:hypothetical protein
MPKPKNRFSTDNAGLYYYDYIETNTQEIEDTNPTVAAFRQAIPGC